MNFVDGGVKGADVSFYQDSNTTPQQIDFSKMVDQGASFVIVRAGQNLWVDPDFAYNWSHADALPRGAYWFYDDRVSPEQQADLCCSLFTDRPELEVWLDLEKDYGGAYAGYQNWKRFIERFRKNLPDVKIGIYTGYYYISGKIPLAEFAYFAQFPLWIAWYTTDPSVVKIPAPWTSCLYWQWGTPAWGIAWGCESVEIDMNKFNGTLEDFQRRYNIIPTGGQMYYGTTLVRLNVRSTPSSTGTWLMTMAVGEKIEADRVEAGWWHLTKIGANATTQEMWAYEGDTKGYIRTDQIVEPPVEVLPAYFLAYDASGKELARYNKV